VYSSPFVINKIIVIFNKCESRILPLVSSEILDLIFTEELKLRDRIVLVIMKTSSTGAYIYLIFLESKFGFLLNCVQRID
jgi:hypothetical protein